MNKLLRNLLLSAAAFAAAATLAQVSLAQVAPSTTTATRQPEPRQLPTQQTHYIRTTFNFDSCTQTANACTVKIMNASLPYNTAILRVSAVTFTAFNSTTSDVFTLGTTAANANEIVSTGCNFRAAGLVACALATTVGTAVGATTAQSGTNGGFDLYLKWTGGGGTPTTGRSTIVVEYAPPNDATCTVTPMGSTAASC